MSLERLRLDVAALCSLEGPVTKKRCGKKDVHRIMNGHGGGCQNRGRGAD